MLPLFVLFLFLKDSLAKLADRPVGVSLAMSSMYEPIGGKFRCFDGSMTVPFGYVNDDYCDCEDGSDEPGTPACLKGKFYCNNIGHQPKYIPSSFVNDGVCDCCDGSDEYASKKECPNTCLILGKAAREGRKKMLLMYKEGNKIRADLCQKAIALKMEKQDRLNELKKELSKLEEIKTLKNNLKVTLEVQEKAAIEECEAKLKVIEQAEAEDERIRAAKEHFDAIDKNKDLKIDVLEIVEYEIIYKDNKRVFIREEAEAILGSEKEVNFSQFIDIVWPRMTMLLEIREQSTPSSELPTEHEEEPAGEEKGEEEQEIEEKEEGEEEEEEEEEEEVGEKVREKWREKFQDLEKNRQRKEHRDKASIVEKCDQKTQQLVTDAETARAEYEEVESKERDINREIRQIQETLEKDYGPDGAFLYMEGECYEFKDAEYTYKLCPFDMVSQRPHGGSEIRLGAWSSWIGENYTSMLYTNGQACWNGPQRQTTVEIHCGLNTELTAVSEPNRCSYLMHFTTPAACTLTDDMAGIDDLTILHKQHEEL